ncbi:hypothetical protein [Yoonia sp. R78084]|uniref:hypothetical protein n=1 Tax=Yoonia sp. R78084 TaxID=3093869 RepID=UPI0037DCA243
MQTKKISFDGQTYDVSLSYDLDGFSVSADGVELTDASILAELYALNRALLFSEAILDVQRGDVLGGIYQAEIAVAHIDIVQQLETTYETVISTAGVVSSLYGGFSGVSRWADEGVAIATELASWTATMAFEDAEAATFHLLVDGVLAAAKDVSLDAYQTYLKAEKTDEVLSASEIIEMARGAAQGVAMSTDLSLLISSFDLESEGWGTLFKDIALSVSGALIDTFKATDTARDLASLDPLWEASIKTSGPLNAGLGLVDFTAGGVEIIAQMQELISNSASYYNGQELNFLSATVISEFEQGFSALLETPDDTSDDYVLENPFDDHGDDTSEATAISLGAINGFTSISGVRETRSDDDVYEVSLSVGQEVAVMLWANSTLNSGLDPFVSVEFPDGRTETNDDLSASSLTSFITFIAPMSGVYTITASGVGSTTGDYILNITPLETDETAAALTEANNPATDDGSVSGSRWDWQGTPDNDSPSTLTLEEFGAPDVDTDNFYRGHDGDDRIEAGRGNDVIWGDDDEDRLYGEDGNDIIRGGRHDDRIYGGDDDDLIYGEDGNDRIYGDTSNTEGIGDDTIYGGDGDDDIRGGRGNDYIKGEDDNDVIRGNDGNDELYGDRGDDELDGDDGNDLLFGGRGNDDIEGDDGHDRLAGEDGDDILEGGAGDDQIFGGDDDDLLTGGTGNDLLHGEDGNDTADFSDGNDGVIANLFDEIASSNDLGTDILYSIENLIGSDGDDVFDGDHSANVLSGGDGDDAIRGHNGNDTLFGGDDDDVLWGDAGDDSIHGDDNDDELRGGLGNDTLNGGRGDDHLRGEQDNDTIDGGTGIDTVFFWGEFEDFGVVEVSPGVIRVTDQRSDGLEGIDTLSNVEFVEFFDRTISVVDLFAPAPAAVDDFSTTTADRVVSVNAAANDQSNASTSWISSASISSGAGLVSIIGGQVIFDPDGQFGHLSGNQTGSVEISYKLETSGGQSVDGVIAIEVSASTTPVPEHSTDDILWRNDDGQVAIWEMQDGEHTYSPLEQVSLEWQIEGTGDFNGDGTDDFVWRNDDGQVAIWEMQDGEHTYSPLEQVSLEWQIEGTGDFNGDGTDDFVWRNDDGQVAIWEMQDGEHTYSPLEQVSLEWQIEGTGDFNGDGTDDFVWRNDDGQVAIWEMQDGEHTYSPLEQVSLEWQIEGTGDFNGDGTDDILWRNDDGQVAIWEMQDGEHTYSPLEQVSLEWQIEGTGDFNGDGTDDILWRNDDGQVAIWEMQDGEHTYSPLEQVSLEWDIV